MTQSITRPRACPWQTGGFGAGAPARHRGGQGRGWHGHGTGSCGGSSLWLAGASDAFGLPRLNFCSEHTSWHPSPAPFTPGPKQEMGTAASQLQLCSSQTAQHRPQGTSPPSLPQLLHVDLHCWQC